MTEPAPQPTPRELALLFLRLGCTAFGGPAAHIAMMEDEVVTRRRWLSREEFLDLVAAVNLLPGPNSTELAIHIGLRAGWRGFLVAGVCFILPATLLTGLLAWAYVAFGALPEAAGLLYGVKPVMIAVVLQALVKLGRDAIRSVFLGIVAGLALLAGSFGADELIVLVLAGMLVAVGRAATRPAPAPGSMALLPLLAWTGTAPTVGLWPLFLTFLKIGSVLFGSGYVLVAFLRSDLVERRGWLTDQQLLDAVAAGQVTPGPVFTTATFIGYLLGGPAGAVLATVGIFLPAFFFVAVSGPLLAWLRRRRGARDFLDGVVVASLALMALVAWNLGRAALPDVVTWVIAATSALLLLRYRVNSSWLVLLGAVVGVSLTWLGAR